MKFERKLKYLLKWTLFNWPFSSLVPKRKEKKKTTPTSIMAMNKKRVYLVCLDGSSHAAEVIHNLLAIVKPDDQVNLLTVVTKTHPDDAAKAGNLLINEQEKIHHKCPEAKVQHYIQKGNDPREEILNLARNLAVDWIIMGSRGLGTIDRIRLGSVSRHVVAHAECPVLVTRPKDWL